MFTRSWQRQSLLFLVLLILAEGGLGVYALRTTPALSFNSHKWVALAEPPLHKIEHLTLDPALVSLRLPEFVSPTAEAAWWRMQEQIYTLLRDRHLVIVMFVDETGQMRNAEAQVGELPWPVVLRSTWLVYLVVAICVGSGIAVFRRHQTEAGTVLAFFLLDCAVYFVSSAPVVSRSLTLAPALFQAFIFLLYTAGAGLVTLAHFALVFPQPKAIVQRHPWIAILPYATFLLATTLYVSGIGAFGSTFPLLLLWVLVIAGTFLHSLLTERDPFLRRQIRLSLMTPVLVSLFFVSLYIMPGILRLPPIDFRYFALFFLILPFALPLAMDNLALYRARLAAERIAQQDKEHLRADLHDLILNNLAVISRSSEVARTQLSGEVGSLGKRLWAIQDLATATSRQLRGFLWALDDRHSDWEPFCGRLREWGAELLEDAGCEFDLDVASAVMLLSAPSLRLRICLDRVYKEALHNVVKHAHAREVKVSLFPRSGFIVCAIEDDGCGFEAGTEEDGHYGLRNMRRRVEELGGRFSMTTNKGNGTRLTIELPFS